MQAAADKTAETLIGRHVIQSILRHAMQAAGNGGCGILGSSRHGTIDRAAPLPDGGSATTIEAIAGDWRAAGVTVCGLFLSGDSAAATAANLRAALQRALPPLGEEGWLELSISLDVAGRLDMSAIRRTPAGVADLDLVLLEDGQQAASR